MTHTPTAAWWKTAVVYEIYPRSFCDHNGDGIGDLTGIVDHLPYLRHTLGVDAIWICPFYPSPLLDFGYDVSDFTGVDATLGTLDDFDALIRAAHDLGIRVLIDYIPNHSADTHQWFEQARSSRTNAKRDWYIWADPAADGGPPNNWTSEMGGSTWEYDEPSGQYYLHSFHSGQPDLNWRNADLRDAMLDVLRFWLARGVDGVRIDVAHMIAKDPLLADNPVRAQPRRNDTDRQHADYDTQVHVNDRLHPDVHQYLRLIRAVLDEFGARTGRERVAIAEVEVMPWPAWSEFFGADLDGIHLPFNFSLIEAAWTPRELAAAVEAQEAAVPPGAWPNYVLQNHDRPRLATRIGEQHVRNAAVLLLTLRGTPTLYYGEELGLADHPIDRALWRDPLGRDESRAPMPWTAAAKGGFCRGGVEPWLPAYPDAERVSVEAQLCDPGSVLSLYRDLLALRSRMPVLRLGDYAGVQDAPPDCLCFVRRDATTEVFVALNLGGRPRTVTLPRPGRVLLTTASARQAAQHERGVTLGPFGGAIVLLDSGRMRPYIHDRPRA